MQDLSDLKGEVELWQALERRVTDGLELLELAEADEDEALVDGIEAEAAKVEAELGRQEFYLILSGPHDRDPAILGLQAGSPLLRDRDTHGAFTGAAFKRAFDFYLGLCFAPATVTAAWAAGIDADGLRHRVAARIEAWLGSDVAVGRFADGGLDDAIFQGIGGPHSQRRAVAGGGVDPVAVGGLDRVIGLHVLPAAHVVRTFIVEARELELALPAGVVRQLVVVAVQHRDPTAGEELPRARVGVVDAGAGLFQFPEKVLAILALLAAPILLSGF